MQVGSASPLKSATNQKSGESVLGLIELLIPILIYFLYHVHVVLCDIM